MRKIAILNFVTFLAAFLLFQIELIISKFLLPDFGGSYLVWGACVVFFQAVLFLGYFCSYFLIKKFKVQKFLPFYLILFLLPLLSFPGKSFPQAATANLNLPLVLNVFWHLSWTIGAVFFALSTVSVILQAWLADSDLQEKRNPYALYALSNLGSFAALITYPFLFEVFLDLDQQLMLWRILYFVLLGAVAVAVFTVKLKPKPGVAAEGNIWSVSGVCGQDVLRWLLFGGAGVVMFLAVTNLLTYEVAPIPLLWVVPLSIYLVSFVLNFKEKPWAPPWVEEKFYLTFAWSIVLFFLILARALPFSMELLLICLFLFHTCMFCQYQLNKSKPVNLDNLALFYLAIAAGGFIGGLITTWVMPLVSVSVCEYLLGLGLIALALMIGTKIVPLGKGNLFLIVYLCCLLMLYPLFFRKYNIIGIVILLSVFKICYANLVKAPRALFLSILVVFFITPLLDAAWNNSDYIYRHRNYYGVYKVSQKGPKVILMHGSTIHGVQYQTPKRENEPLAYYHKLTPVGGVLSKVDFGRHIGIIGLGSGGLTAYLRPGQELDYFEIDPDVQPIAQELFTYTRQAKGKINYIFGDARLMIKAAPVKYYNLLVVDAFSGDAVPVHLLTVEAINEYRRHLADGGVIMFHISNRYLDFIPVLLSNANLLDAFSCFKQNSGDVKIELFATTWFALSWDMQVINRLLTEFDWARYIPGKYRLVRPWTDKYSNMLFIIKLNEFLNSIRYFQPFYW